MAENKGILPSSTFNTLGNNSNKWEAVYAKKFYGEMGDVDITKIKSYITESVVNSDGSWYRKYSDGWLEQGGIISASATQSGADYFYTFNFALPFSKVMTCVANSDTYDLYNGNVETLTNTYFIMRQDNGRPNIKAKYIACGMGVTE